MSTDETARETRPVRGARTEEETALDGLDLPATLSPHATYDATRMLLVGAGDAGDPGDGSIGEVSILPSDLDSLLATVPGGRAASTDRDVSADRETIDPSSETGRPAPPESELFAAGVPLGRGGFGDVWTGVQRSLLREVAIKRLRPDLLAGRPEAERRQLEAMFRHEARVTARLEHPNIVPVYHLDADENGRELLAMRWVRGRPWHDLIVEDLEDDRPLDEHLERHLPILVDVAQAVAYAHSRGVLHRDLKPRQVVVGAFGEVQLMDWGLALPHPLPADLEAGPDTADDEMPSTQGPSGTPSFMAPEQVRDALDEIGPLTDVYLLGGCLYFVLTGRPPHDAPTTRATLVQALIEDVVPPERLSARPLPQDLCELVRGCLAREPAERRPQTAESFAEALQAYLTGASRRRRARRRIAEVEAGMAADPDAGYESLGERLATLREAEALWPESPDIPPLRARLLTSYAGVALSRGDLDLARFQARQLPAGTRLEVQTREELLSEVDTARRRRASRARQRTWALLGVGALLVALALGGVKYATDVAEANERLVVERDAARAARAEAEGLMSYMLDEVWQSFESIGRLDLMAPLAQRADAYYRHRDPSALSPDGRLRRARALEAVAESLFYAGDQREARIAAERWIEALEDLVAERPERVDLRIETVQALSRLAMLHTDVGELDRALAIHQRIGARVESLATLEDVEPVRLLELRSLVLDGRGVTLFDRGDLEAAHRDFSRAIEALEQADRLDSAGAVERASPMLHMRRSVTALRTDRLELALSSGARALEEVEAQIRREPADASAVVGLAFVASVYSEALTAAGRLDQAVDVLRGAVAPARTQVERDPENVETRYNLALSLYQLGLAEDARGRSSAARDAWAEAVEIAEPAATTDNAYLVDTLVRAYLHLGRRDDARPLVDRLRAEGWRHDGFEEVVERFGVVGSASSDAAEEDNPGE